MAKAIKKASAHRDLRPSSNGAQKISPLGRRLRRLAERNLAAGAKRPSRRELEQEIAEIRSG